METCGFVDGKFQNFKICIFYKLYKIVGFAFSVIFIFYRKKKIEVSIKH